VKFFGESCWAHRCMTGFFRLKKRERWMPRRLLKKRSEAG
jgi:hypothetical protein